MFSFHHSKRLYSGSGENEEPPNKKKRIMSHKTQALQSIKDNYNDLLTEYFFLSVSLNFLCFVTGFIVNFDL